MLYLCLIKPPAKSFSLSKHVFTTISPPSCETLGRCTSLPCSLPLSSDFHVTPLCSWEGSSSCLCFSHSPQLGLLLSITTSLWMIKSPWYIVCTIFFSFGLFRATPKAYGSSRAKGQISLHHSHSTVAPELHLRPTLQLMAKLDP